MTPADHDCMTIPQITQLCSAIHNLVECVQCLRSEVVKERDLRQEERELRWRAEADAQKQWEEAELHKSRRQLCQKCYADLEAS